MAGNEKLMAEIIGKGNRLTSSTAEAFARSIGPGVEVFDHEWVDGNTEGAYSPLRYISGGWQRFCRADGTWMDTAASPTELEGDHEPVWVLERAGTAHERFAIGSSPTILLTEDQLHTLQNLRARGASTSGPTKWTQVMMFDDGTELLIRGELKDGETVAWSAYLSGPSETHLRPINQADYDRLVRDYTRLAPNERT